MAKFLVCFVLCCSAFVTEAEVVDTLNYCNQFFYMAMGPFGFEDTFSQNGLSKICQRYQGRYHFASLHSSDFRMPIYSAYKLETFNCPATQAKRRSQWFIEPQLSGSQYPSEMTTEGASSSVYKQKQAINIDFPNTNFDRGHLNPSFYQCDDSRTATFTLTNAVPQDPCFNQQRWKQMEEKAKTTMFVHCNFGGAQRFFVTGAIPSTTTIPSEFDDKEGDEVREYDRVTVPELMWTAACCDSSQAFDIEDRNKGFSFGYYSKNIPDSWVIPSSVSVLEALLREKYPNRDFSIFAGGCYSSSETTFVVINELDVIVEKEVVKTVIGFDQSGESSVPGSKINFIENFYREILDFPATSIKDWRISNADIGLIETRTNIMKTRELLAATAFTTLLTNPRSYKPAARVENVHNNRKNETESSIDNEKVGDAKDGYKVIPALSSEFTVNGDRCRQNHTCDFHDKKLYKWCYTDWSNNWDYCCVDKCKFTNIKDSSPQCYVGNSMTPLCTQRSSMVTVTGRVCRGDHECGLHGESYYWCYTDSNDNYDYCCQPWHECSDHDETYNWCYTGVSKEASWQYCYY